MEARRQAVLTSPLYPALEALVAHHRLPRSIRRARMAGRLRRAAFQLAMLRTYRYVPPGSVAVEMVGDTLLPQPVVTATDGTDIAEQQVGATLLLAALLSIFHGCRTWRLASLDQQFSSEISQGMHQSDFLLIFRTSYDEAAEHRGLQMNKTGRAYHL